MSDLIERSKAVDAIYWNVMEVNSKEMAESVLSDVPTIDAEPVRHGHWIGVEEIGFDDGKPVYVVYKCSICGEKHKGEEFTLTDYCPHCGAKMDAEEETEVWNCSNGRKIVAPKGTFDKLYYSEDEDEDV